MPRQRKQRGAGSSALPFKEITAKLANEELIKRLKDCLNYLEDIDEVVDGTNDELITLSLDLLSPSILNKTDETRSLVALVLANLYRLFLLDIPHNEKQKKSVFRLFISSFDSLKKSSDSLYKQTYSLLEILSVLSLFNMCLKFDDQDILVELFKKIQEIIRYIPDQAHQVEQFLLKIMFSVLQEASHLSDQLLDTVLLPLIEPHKSDEPLVYSFICKLIQKSSQYLEPFLRHFFNGILVNGEESDSAVADSLYELIPQLYSIDNYLLLLILPQLEWKLQSVDVEVRSKVTQLLGPMFSAPGSKLSTENSQLFHSYLGRCQDFSPSIRLEVVKECKSLLLNHPHLRDELTEKLLPRVVDQDEKVRMEVVKSILDAATEDLTCIDERLLDSLQHRMRDKKWPVRKYTMMSLVKLYKNNLSNERLQWIPRKLLHSFHQPFQDDKICITRCLNSCIIPAGAEINEKIDRLLHICYTNDESANRSLIDILNTQKTIREHLLSIVSATDEENEISDEERKKIVAVKSAAIAGCLPDPLKTQASLRELPSDEVLMKKLADSIDVTKDHQSLTKAKTEVYLHVSDNQPLVELLKMLHDVSSPVLINRDCAVALSNRIYKEMSNPSLLQSEEDELEEQEKCKKGLQLLKVLSGIERAWFHDEELLQNVMSLLRHKDNEIVQNSLLILHNIGSVINDTFTSISSVLSPLLFQLACKSSPKSAKLAVQCLISIYPNNKSNFERLYEMLVDGLDLGSVHLESVLKSLSVLAENRHPIFEKHRNDVIVRFAVKKILEQEVDEDEIEEEESEVLNLWSPDSDLSVDTRLRLHILLIVPYSINRLLQ
uniref:Uncharacterized protein n=1 Tax=Amphimedon queenslandica TaxID=400682 RepID=A0A1X7TX01_AMPQE